MGDLNTRDNETFLPPNMAEPKGYGLSGKIMLSAIVILFAVVIIMVCLHIYARWYILNARRRQIRRARRRTHLVFYIEPNNPSNIVPIPTRGLDARVLHSLPTFKYKQSSEDHQVLECAVCLSEFEDGERGRLLPKCKHNFHVDCIDMWFHSHSTCPICRSSVDLDDEDCINFKSGVNGGGGDGEGLLPPPLEDVVVELTTDSTPIQLGPSSELDGPSQPIAATGCSSFGDRRKGFVGVSSIEVPTRSQSFSFTNNLDESRPSPSPSQGFKSPTSRILSLKRILSREKRSPLPSPSGVGTSRCNGSELDLEFGRVEETSQVLTPRK